MIQFGITASPWTGYAIAVITTGLALLIKVQSDQLIGPQTPFLLFFSSVLVSSWYGGLGPGLVAAVLGGIVSSYYFLHPTESFLGLGKNFRLAVFLGESLLISYLSSARKKAEETLRTVNQVNMSLAGELNLEKLVQSITDAGTRLSGAEFGAFFYNESNDEGESYMLYALSGAPREQFSSFAVPRNTELFGPTFRGKKIIRIKDVTRDPRYGKNAPHYGMPKGHLPVRSYLAAPVVSRSGEVIGGLFFGHQRPGVFTSQAEELISGIASQSAVAIDNARLYDSAQKEIAERRRAETQLQDLNQTLEKRVRERTAIAERRSNQLQRLASELTLAEHRERRRLSNLLHDHLQQILTAAQFRVERLANKIKDTAFLEEFNKVYNLIKDSIQTSRNLSVELSPPILYEGGLIAGLEWLARWMKEKHELEVEVWGDPAVDPVTDDLKVTIFESVRELLLNIVKHAATDHARIRLSLLENDRIEVTVSDPGAGFDPEIVQSSGQEHSLGLFSIRERLEALKGNLKIESTVGKGTHIALILPRSIQERQAASLPSRRDPKDAFEDSISIEPEARKIRVLIADDQEIVREGLVVLIEDQPDLDIVGQTENGEEAVRLTRALEPDVVIMDITMPVLNGIEATKQIVSTMPEVKIIGLSVHDEKDMAQAMWNAGAVRYLTKGRSSSSLVAAIRDSVLFHSKKH